MEEELHRQAILYLLDKLCTNNSVNQKYIKDVEEALEKTVELLETIDNINSLSEAIDMIRKAGVNVSESELNTILDYLLNDAAGDIKEWTSGGVTTTQYIALTICLYEMDGKILDDLQKCSAPGKLLYDDVELIKKDRQSDVEEYFKNRYCNEIFAKSATEVLLKLAGKEATGLLDAVGMVTWMVADMNGVPDLSELILATCLMSYLTDVKTEIAALQLEIHANYDNYSDEELKNKIEDYEMLYNTYLSMIEPVLSAVNELEKFYNYDLQNDANIPSFGYDYNRYIAMAMSFYADRKPLEYKWAKGFDIIQETQQDIGQIVLPSERTGIQEKLDLLLQRLNANVYFTVNQAACSSTREVGHGCENCSVSNIVKAEWFKSLFGDIDTSCFPSHDYSETGRDYKGRSCFGFACFVQWYLFADSRDENLVGKRVATIKFNKNEIMNNVKAGDVLRVNGHSLVVYSVEQNGINAVDCNWNMGGQLNCVVQKHFIPYDAQACAGYTTYVNRVTKTVNIDSGMAGVFDIDDVGANGAGDKQEGTSISQSGKTYGTLDLSSTSWSGYNVGLDAEMYADKEYTIRHGAQLEILDKVINSKGNEIYYVYSSDLGMNCYVSSKYVKIEEQPCKTYGTLDLSATSWSGYNVGLNAEMYADKEYTIRNGARLEILGKVTNSKGNEIYHVYSPDLGMNCYVSVKYVKINEAEPTIEHGKVPTLENETTEKNAIGWFKDIKDRWRYIISEDGKYAKGWFQTAAKLWYYLGEDDGYMHASEWFCDPESRRWYYLDNNGAMCTGWITVDDIWYYLDKDGAMCTGWNKIDDNWYLFGASGAMLRGWQTVNGKQYYLAEDGKCLINATTPDGYRVDENGAKIN